MWDMNGSYFPEEDESEWDDDEDWKDEDEDDASDDLDAHEQQLRSFIRKLSRQRFGIELPQNDDIRDAITDDLYYEFCYEYEDMLDIYDHDAQQAFEDEAFQERVASSLESRLREEGLLADERIVNEDDYRNNRQENRQDKAIGMFTDDDIRYNYENTYTGYTVFRDKKMQSKGYSRENIVLDGVTNYYDANHQLKGYSRKSFLDDGMTNYYDSKGKKLGFSRPSFLNPSETNYYDSRGNLVGKSHRDFLTGIYQIFDKKKK